MEVQWHVGLVKEETALWMPSKPDDRIRVLEHRLRVCMYSGISPSMFILEIFRTGGNEMIHNKDSRKRAIPWMIREFEIRGGAGDCVMHHPHLGNFVQTILSIQPSYTWAYKYKYIATRHLHYIEGGVGGASERAHASLMRPAHRIVEYLRAVGKIYRRDSWLGLI